jgi:Ca2+-binding EF-hand superfamily protein
MRHTWLGTALAALVLSAGAAPGQGPPPWAGGGDRDRGGDRGSRGMFGGGPPDGNMIWTMMNRGGDPNATTINLNERTDIRDRMVQRGQPIPPDGILRKEQFVADFQARMASGGGFGGPGGPGGGPPGSGGSPSGMSFSFGRGGPSYPDPATATEDQIREAMRRTDRDGDGRVSAEEGGRSDKLRERFASLDTNRDGFLDVAEYRGYVAVRYAEQVQEQQQRGMASVTPTPGSPPPGFSGGFVPPSGTPSQSGQSQDDERPVAIRFGKLPKEVPTWFEKYDTDQDGQIGLYEWRAAGEATAKFVEMDHTGDGYLTADEWVRFTRMTLEKKPDADSTAAPSSGGPGGDRMSRASSSGRSNPFDASSSRGGPGGPPAAGSDGGRRSFFGGPGGGPGGPGGGPPGMSRGGRDREKDKDKDKDKGNKG